MWVILSPSAVNPFRECVLGEGATEKEAWLDATGEEGKKRRGWYSKEVTEEEFYEHYQQY